MEQGRLGGVKTGLRLSGEEAEEEAAGFLPQFKENRGLSDVGSPWSPIRLLRFKPWLCLASCITSDVLFNVSGQVFPSRRGCILVSSLWG